MTWGGFAVPGRRRLREARRKAGSRWTVAVLGLYLVKHGLLPPRLPRGLRWLGLGGRNAGGGNSGAAVGERRRERAAVPQTGEECARPGDARERGRETHLPIVFIHRSNSGYLRYSLQQARRSNPDSTVFLIGDETNAGHEGVEHRFYSDYFDEAAELTELYRHFNTTGYATELFNFQRWFVLRDFLREHGLRRCLYLDSDVMLYGNPTEGRDRWFDDFGLSLACCWIPCTVFVNRIELLDEFCRFVKEIYSGDRPYEFDRMVAQYGLRRKNGLTGGACDMTAFELFHYGHFGEIGDVSLVRGGAVYDPGLTIPNPGLEMSGGRKKVFWKDGMPYGVHARTGEEVRFASLHFQGRWDKALMPDYLMG